MKILVLGASGMAGHVISLYLIESGFEVHCFSRTKVNYGKSIIGDATDFNNLKELINNGDYDVIINAIGILNNDAENNKATAILVNSYLPHFLSEITSMTTTRIIHISTDCVFSGKEGGYLETSIPDGESFYDRTKALGEINNEKDLTFRTSIVGPDMKYNGIGLFNWFMKTNDTILGYKKAIWTGVTTLTLAKAIEDSLYDNITGVYNLVNNLSISKYELLSLFNKIIRGSKIEIMPNEKIEINKSLINSRQDFKFVIPDYLNMIKEMKEWIIKHKELYKHYFIEGELI